MNTHSIDLSEGSLYFKSPEIYNNELIRCWAKSQVAENLFKIQNIMSSKWIEYAQFLRDKEWKIILWISVPNPQIH